MKRYNNLTDRLTFGKFKGLTIKYVIDNQVEYIKWLIDKKILDLSIEVFRYYSQVLMNNIVFNLNRG